MGKAADCMYCLVIENNAENPFFNCDMWAMSRASLVADIGMIVPDNIARAMLRGEGCLELCDTLNIWHPLGEEG